MTMKMLLSYSEGWSKSIIQAFCPLMTILRKKKRKIEYIMKILAYNINLSSQEKIDKVLGYDADVYILPEVACPSQVKLPDSYRMEWMGDVDYKGLGIIWKSNLNATVPSWFNPKHQYFFPLFIDGKLIMAAWPTTTEQNKPMRYPQIALVALQEYAPYFKEYPTIISGDMNCYMGQSGQTKQFSIRAIFDFFGEMGIVSAYHNKTGEELGKESKATYYHQFKDSLPFFIDYTFSNIRIKSYRLGNWDRNISDHVPQFIEI